MAVKEQIINNIREYSASDIVTFIKNGDITLYELSKSGNLTPLMRKKIEELLSNSECDQVFSNNDESGQENLDETDTQINESLDTTNDIDVNALHEVTSNIQESTSVDESPQVIKNAIDNNSDINLLDNKGMFNRVFSFKGRIRRTEYGLSYIIFFIWYVVFAAITETQDFNPFLALIVLLSIVPAYWFLWAQGAKRCHDRGNSGWYQIIPFYFFVMIFGKGEDGINNYGTNPKE